MTTTTQLAPSPRSTLRRIFGPLVDVRTWKETAALLLALPMGIAWFTIAVTGLSVSAGLLVTVVGLPLLAVAVQFGRVVGTVERATSRALLGTDLGAPPPLDRDGSRWVRVKRMLVDRAAWKGIGYALVSLPVGIVTFATVVTLWSVAAAMTAFPLYAPFTSDFDDVPDAFSSMSDGWARFGAVAGVGVLGLILLALTPRIVHRLAEVQRGLVRRWLSPIS